MAPIDKHQVARILEDIAVLLDLKGESPFKSMAYSNAAREIESSPEDVTALVTSGRLRDLKGIGRALAERIGELVTTGRLAYYDELKASVPPGLVEMTAIPGLGPKKILAVWQKLGITTIGELEYACIENRLVGLPGFGEKTQEKIKQGLLQHKKCRGFHLFAAVAPEARRIVEALRTHSAVRDVHVVGELRRCMEILCSIDLLVAGDDPHGIGEVVGRVEGLSEVQQSGTRFTIQSAIGVPVRVTVMPRVTPYALLGATGSAEHVAALASRAARMGVPWQIEGEGGAGSEADSEEALYAQVGLPFIPPELREGLGEIDWAEAGELRPLVDAREIQGVFHTHTTASDGSATLEEMVLAAKEQGFRYIGISDHSQSAFYANGLKEDRIREQHAAIDALRNRIQGIRIFKGIESDILANGALDYPDAVLAAFDFVIGSVHGRFNLSEEEQTLRLVRAMANPYLTMLGHPTGRLLLSREGYRVDMKRIIDAAKEHAKIIEVNANPHRLDLDWRFCRYARSRGVKVSINPDAHATGGLADVPFGVNVARKGGLTASDVINTRGPDEILSAMKAG
jgi:DNA polymerase (family 10)